MEVPVVDPVVDPVVAGPAADRVAEASAALAADRVVVRGRGLLVEASPEAALLPVQPCAVAPLVPEVRWARQREHPSAV